jgi:hypothetical protein
MVFWSARDTVLDWAAVDEQQSNLPGKEGTPAQPAMSDTDARLAARLAQMLITPGISDKDRKLVERNLQRLKAALRPAPDQLTPS